jgi:hypothetical protein
MLGMNKARTFYLLYLNRIPTTWFSRLFIKPRHHQAYEKKNHVCHFFFLWFCSFSVPTCAFFSFPACLFSAFFLLSCMHTQTAAPSLHSLIAGQFISSSSCRGQGAGVLRWGWMPMPVATRGRRSWGTPREENHPPSCWPSTAVLSAAAPSTRCGKTGAASKHLSSAAASSTTSATTPDRVCRKRQCHRSEQHQRRAPEHEAWRDGSGAQASPSCLYLLLWPCLIQLIFSFFTNLSRTFAKQLASATAYQFSCFSEYTKNSQQAQAAFHQLIR